MTARRELPAGVDAVEYESAGWLRMRRGPFEVVCNFADAPLRLPCAGARRLAFASDDRARVKNGAVELPSLSGALLR